MDRQDDSCSVQLGVNLEVRYAYRAHGVLHSGTGRTTELSGNLVRFECDEPIPLRVRMELRMEWPSLLQKVCALDLILSGELTAIEGTAADMRIDTSEFRTVGSHSFEAHPHSGTSYSVFA